MPADRPLGTVLVTGGASGLGAAVAAAVEEAGGTAVVLDRVAPQNGFAFEQVDLARPREAEAAVRRAAERAGGLDAIVTAAGTDACGDIGDVEPDAWDRVVLVNLLGTAAVVRAALPHLEASRGRVVTVASTLGLRALPAATAYCASKFGVVGFTRALAIEMGDRVGVTMLVPGGMKTHFFDDRTGRLQARAGPAAQRPARRRAERRLRAPPAAGGRAARAARDTRRRAVLAVVLAYRALGLRRLPDRRPRPARARARLSGPSPRARRPRRAAHRWPRSRARSTRSSTPRRSGPPRRARTSPSTCTAAVRSHTASCGRRGRGG